MVKTIATNIVNKGVISSKKCILVKNRTFMTSERVLALLLSANEVDVLIFFYQEGYKWSKLQCLIQRRFSRNQVQIFSSPWADRKHVSDQNPERTSRPNSSYLPVASLGKDL